MIYPPQLRLKKKNLIFPNSPETKQKQMED